ncbi:adenine deaminase [Pontibacillus yanchengensis]|uniref:Adenine deaminase n=1 Tax=Pontibacillus yanchengensis TaxID=462910 RepID=A0ACC7VJM2_9BACI|nr:adenine deaminase [Pontibacillus yanchengensis]MYL54344.1 adenine deaminase [Pontibacillus yanchengensis]
MTHNKNQFQKQIAVANKTIPADLVIKNGRIVDVFNGEIVEGDVAICEGIFVGVGNYDGKTVIDAQNSYVSPSFIDGHVHIESSMLTPNEFAKVVLPHGVTTVVTDPHEIANVAGTSGIHYMLQNSDQLELDSRFMLPSCVPATPFENTGATLASTDLKGFYAHSRVHGLAEVMDYPSLQNGADWIVDKILQNNEHRNHIDGHLAGLDTHAINIYRTAGVMTDHECKKEEDARERLRRGMYLMLREGSVAKDLTSLIGAVTPQNTHRCLFCTDDKHLDDLIEEGSIDYNVRLAIQLGLSPIQAIQMGSLNAAQCYDFKQKGAIAPGYEADFLLLDNLETIDIHEVYKGGRLVAKNGSYVGNESTAEPAPAKLTDTVHAPEMKVDDLRIPIKNQAFASIIQITPNDLVTKKIVDTVHVVDGSFSPSVEKDQQKLVVVERHHNTGNIGVGIVNGFGFQSGAIATTIAHDSHNIVATGTNDEDILAAIEALKTIHGGLVVVKDGVVEAQLPLPVAGLMSEQPYDVVNNQLHDIHQALTRLGFANTFDPFLTMSFVTLPVIPSIKLTDTGLFDVERFTHIPVEAQPTNNPDVIPSD